MLWPIYVLLGLLAVLLLVWFASRDSHRDPNRTEPILREDESATGLPAQELTSALDRWIYSAEPPDLESDAGDATGTTLPAFPDMQMVFRAVWETLYRRDYHRLTQLAGNEAIDSLLRRRDRQTHLDPLHAARVVSADRVSVERRGPPSVRIRYRYLLDDLGLPSPAAREEIWTFQLAHDRLTWTLASISTPPALTLVKDGTDE